MIPILLDGPAIEPISLMEAKTWLKLDDSAEDDLVQALIVAARLMVEAEIGQVLVGQTWRLVGDFWPPCEQIPVRIGQVLSVVGARVYSVEGQPTAIASGTITILPERDPPVIVPSFRPVPGRATSGIEIDLRLGFGEAAADVPETIRLAIRRLVALWYENRGDSGDMNSGLPPQIRALLRPFRRIRL